MSCRHRLAFFLALCPMCHLVSAALGPTDYTPARARTSLPSSAAFTVAAVLWGRWVHPLTQEWGNNQNFQPDPHYMVWSCKLPLKIKEAKEMVQGVTWFPEATLK